MNDQSKALALVKIAALIFPPLASLIRSLLGEPAPDEDPLAAKVRAILPEHSATREVLDELEGKATP